LNHDWQQSQGEFLQFQERFSLIGHTVRVLEIFTFVARATVILHRKLQCSAAAARSTNRHTGQRRFDFSALIY
jgi:hypothetical protein